MFSWWWCCSRKQEVLMWCTCSWTWPVWSPSVASAKRSWKLSPGWICSLTMQVWTHTQLVQIYTSNLGLLRSMLIGWQSSSLSLPPASQHTEKVMLKNAGVKGPTCSRQQTFWPVKRVEAQACCNNTDTIPVTQLIWIAAVIIVTKVNKTKSSKILWHQNSSFYKVGGAK